MSSNFSTRLFVICSVMYLALSVLFHHVPPSLFWLFNPKQDINLQSSIKPGIDMVGGFSLVYEIIPPEGSFNSNLAQDVASALKRRVDPQGVRNFVWRPSGANRLEIQVPLTEESKQAKPLRDAYVEAQNALATTNISLGQVRAALRLPPEQRAAQLDRLAMGWAERRELLDEIASEYATLQAAQAGKDAFEQAQAELAFDQSLQKVRQTNLDVASFEAVLDLRDAEARQSRLDEIRQANQGFGARLAAMDTYETAYAAYAKVRDSVDDIEQVKRLLQGSGVLSFHIVAHPDHISVDKMLEYKQRLITEGPRPRAGDELRWMKVGRKTEFDPGQANVGDYNEDRYLLVWVTPNRSLINRTGQPEWALKGANSTNDQSGRQAVAFTFDDVGAKLFFDMTGKHVGYQLAPALDNVILSAPNINSQIGANGIITGGRDGFSSDELGYLVSTLSAGSLPAQLKSQPIIERTIGPQLGEDNLERGLWACYFGVGVVAVFLIGYYYLAGVVAMCAVLLNLVLILAGMAAFGATFTLPSVAGIILTIGMAVDANVLIFERLREEQKRGMGIRIALRNAYERAASAIWDANLTTAITAAILYIIGSEDVKGFGLTLLLGILSSMFTALYVTRTIFIFLIDKFGIESLGSVPLTFPKWDRILNPGIDWMRLAWPAFIGSFIMIVLGTGVFVYKFQQGKMLDTEFAGGTTVQIALKDDAPISEIREIVEKVERENRTGLPAPSVQSVGDGNRSYEIITVNSNVAEVRSIIENAFSGMLDVQPTIRFTDDQLDFAEARQNIIVPIESDQQSIAGGLPDEIEEHVGGVAIVLKNLTPMVSADEIKSRVEQRRLAMDSGVAFKSISVVESPDGEGLIVMASAPEFDYDGNDPLRVQQWSDSLAKPIWNATVDGLTAPGQLQRISSIDQSVGSEAQLDALLAIIVSVIFIVVYIWLRFGDFKYGIATIIATIHDTMFCIALLGFAHLLVDFAPGLAVATQIEPFRINLVIVAAILTVIGYSMNDTVVVFDRVRENRGKYGHVDKAVLNESINQTLSRTILTGGTTMVTIFVMFLMGGTGIHGFTFVLLGGIIVGTYSSIAIASPLLLIGQKVAETIPSRQGSENVIDVIKT